MKNKKAKYLYITAVLVFTTQAIAFAGGSGESNSLVKIGMYADLSAGTAQWGIDTEKGGKLRVKEANVAGGVLGRQIELIVYDIKNSPTEAVRAYTRLAQEDKVCVINGSLQSNTALAVAPVAEQIKIPVVTRALDERVTTPQFNPDDPDKKIAPNRYFFLTQPSAFQHAGIIASYAVHELKMDTFAMLYTPANAYALFLAKGFEYYVKKNGKKMLGNLEFQVGDQDFRSQLTKIRELNPDGLFIPNYVPENANAVKQSRELGVKSRFLGNNSWYKPMDEVAGSSADGAYFPNNFAFDNPRLKSFIDSYKAEWGEDPGLHSSSGYDDVGLMIDAIARAGTEDPEKIRQALEETKGFKGAVAEITMNPATHRPLSISMAILKFTGAKIETVEYSYFAK
jgi:branched-chain amino acid transport system substrate-binding protein